MFIAWNIQAGQEALAKTDNGSTQYNSILLYMLHTMYIS